VTVVVARFDPILERGLAEVLRDDRRLRVVSSGLGGAELVREVTRLAPRVVILDEASHRSLSVCLRSARPTIGIVVLEREPSSPYGMVLLAAGVTCLAWSASVADVLTAVRFASQDGCVFVSGDDERVERHDWHRGPRLLTQRESQVLERLSEGESPGKIALDLEITAATVRKHIASLLSKLRAQSKRELLGLPVFGIR
jgi:DNA-binding NarL/FixJ family response regulator